MLVCVLVRRHLVVHVILRGEVGHGVILATLLLRRWTLFGGLSFHWLTLLGRLLITLLLLWLLLGLWLIVHLFVVVGCLGSQVLFSLGLSLWWLRVMIWVLVMVWVVVIVRADRRVLVRIWLIPLSLHWEVWS